MSCYFRGLGDIFTAAGITVTKANRKQIDEALHKFVGLEEKHCPTAWRKIKQEVLTDDGKRQELIIYLQKVVK